MTDCNICATKTNKVNYMIGCAYCAFESCKVCTQTFLIGLDDDKPRCMNPQCKKVWTGDFLSENFPNSFHNQVYRDRKTQIAFERQKSLLPETQELLESNRKIKTQIKELSDEEEALRARLRLISEQKDALRQIINSDRKITTKRVFIKACPVNECRGFLSSDFICGMCDVQVCKDCHIPIGNKDAPEEHKCDPNTVETIKLLARDTKPCPNPGCGTPIFKISGCDQMYCTKCHSAFSWKSGLIETGTIHNPHFYEWQRKQNGGVAPRVQGDDVCGRRLEIRALRHALDKFKIKVDTLDNQHRFLGHLDYILTTRYNNQDIENHHRVLRMEYLEKNIDEGMWFNDLKRSLKQKEKNEALRDILNMVCTTLSDIFNNIYASKSRSEVNDHITSMEELRLYTNNTLDNIGRRFKNNSPTIPVNWETVGFR
jgi:hypothetical protein